MTRTSYRAQRFSVMCAVAAVVSLGWSPLHALADDVAIDGAVPSVEAATDQVAEAVTATAAPDAVSGTASGAVETISNAASGAVETVSNAASGAVETVSNAASGAVETVSNAASGAVENVSNAASGAVENVSNAASGAVANVANAASGTLDKSSGAASGAVDKVSGAVGDTAAGIGRTAGNVASGTLKGAGLGNEIAAATSSPSLPLFSSQRQAAADSGSSRAMPRSPHDDLVLLAERGRGPAMLDQQPPESCVVTVGSTCVATAAGDAPGSWEGSLASILQRLLALTGAGLLTWIAASCILTVMGSLALFETKRRSGGYPLRSSRLS